MEVTSACSSPVIIGTGHQTAKRKFFQWAVKWFYANMAEDTLEKPDAPALICLLQAIGFQLREFEKIDESNRGKNSKPNKDTVRLFVECGTSGMRACLELNDVKCKCPNSEIAKDASFWSVSGTGPNATAKIETTNTIEESGCNLLPPLAKETMRIIHDVTYHLLNVISDKSSDVNQNSNDQSNMNNISCMINDNKTISDKAEAEKLKNTSTSIVRSYTQPEIHLSNPTKRKFNWTIRQFDKFGGGNDRDGSKWNTVVDLDSEIIDNDQPRPSPPKIASSPVIMNQLCSSLGQISLQSDEETNNVVDHVVRARTNLDRAIEILTSKKSPRSHNSSTCEQGTFLKPAPGGLYITGSGSRRLSTSSRGSNLRSPSGSTLSSLNSTCSTLPSEQTHSRVGKTLTQSGSGKSSILTRRSVGSALLSTSTTVVTPTTTTMKRQVSNVEQNVTSKIPARRKSFGVVGSQPLKLAATSAKAAAATALKKKASTETSETTANQSMKMISSLNQPTGNLKFGYVKKKSSLI